MIPLGDHISDGLFLLRPISGAELLSLSVRRAVVDVRVFFITTILFTIQFWLPPFLRADTRPRGMMRCRPRDGKGITHSQRLVWNFQ
jgi:hypothetical protein